MIGNRHLLPFCLLVAATLHVSAAPDPPPKLRLDLRDGANFSGIPTTNGIVVLTSYARIRVPFVEMRSLERYKWYVLKKR